jgi:hypothetical protein
MNSYEELPTTPTPTEPVIPTSPPAAPKKKKVRDSEYLKRRLAKKRPDILADLESKKIGSVRQAAAKAEIIKLPSRLDGMKRHWKKISKADKDAFLDWTRTHDTTGTPHPLVTSTSITDADGYLVPEVRKFIREWLAKTNSRPARIMEAMGANPYDYTVSAATNENHPQRPRQEIVDKLKRWLTAQGYR